MKNPISCLFAWSIVAAIFGGSSATLAEDQAAAAPKPKTPETPATKTPPAPEAKAAKIVRQEIADDVSWGQISGARVNVRTAPNAESVIAGTLGSGEFIKARALEGVWLEIEWPKNFPAWIARDAVEIDAAASTDSVQKARVKFSKLRVYSQGTPSSPVLAELPRGTLVVIKDETGDWFKIEAPVAAKAYVHSKYAITGVPAPANAPAPVAAVAVAPKPAVVPEAVKIETPPEPDNSAAIEAAKLEVAVLEKQRAKLAEEKKLLEREAAELAAAARQRATVALKPEQPEVKVETTPIEPLSAPVRPRGIIREPGRR